MFELYNLLVALKKRGINFDIFLSSRTLRRFYFFFYCADERFWVLVAKSTSNRPDFFDIHKFKQTQNSRGQRIECFPFHIYF